MLNLLLCLYLPAFPNSSVNEKQPLPVGASSTYPSLQKGVENIRTARSTHHPGHPEFPLKQLHPGVPASKIQKCAATLPVIRSSFIYIPLLCTATAPLCKMCSNSCGNSGKESESFKCSCVSLKGEFSKPIFPPGELESINLRNVQ